MKLSPSSRKDLHQTVQNHCENEGISVSEARQEVRNFLKGASSMLVSEALGIDNLELRKNNQELQKAYEVSMVRFSDQMKEFHKQKSAQ